MKIHQTRFKILLGNPCKAFSIIFHHEFADGPVPWGLSQVISWPLKPQPLGSPGGPVGPVLYLAFLAAPAPMKPGLTKAPLAWSSQETAGRQIFQYACCGCFLTCKSVCKSTQIYSTKFVIQKCSKYFRFRDLDPDHPGPPNCKPHEPQLWRCQRYPKVVKLSSPTVGPATRRGNFPRVFDRRRCNRRLSREGEQLEDGDPRVVKLDPDSRMETMS